MPGPVLGAIVDIIQKRTSLVKEAVGMLERTKLEPLIY